MSIGLRRLSLLRMLKAIVVVPPPATQPTSTVTVIVPARNEERNIEACIRSLLDQSYPDYQVMAVDDSSEDATLAILRKLQAESPKLKIKAAPPMPAGWVGKSWALAVGTREATGDWLLFTDAEHQPGALAAGVALLLGLSWGPFALTGMAMAWLAAGSGGGVWPWLALAFGGLGILWQMARGIGIAAVVRIPLGYGLLHPLGITFFAGILLNSAFLVLSGRGVAWKGRRYHQATDSG